MQQLRKFVKFLLMSAVSLERIFQYVIPAQAHYCPE
jgi:hypothetical protein